MSTNPLFIEDAFGSGLPPQEFIGAYNLHNSAPELLNVSVFYNDTTEVVLSFAANPTPPPIRLSQTEPINSIVDAFLNVAANASTRVYASLMGIREASRFCVRSSYYPKGIL